LHSLVSNLVDNPVENLVENPVENWSVTRWKISRCTTGRPVETLLNLLEAWFTDSLAGQLLVSLSVLLVASTTGSFGNWWLREVVVSPVVLRTGGFSGTFDK
jgi:hypothetical protein